ncbi:MAG: CcoQ/FixQ family Cbb3-type cytochrome c oxidase assembly chaperone [Planctomycetota bacterium]|jgi:cbb3-type cytochrome oxidase subunit 3|nr:CcoQ/FixQ family Cbb3-type cytochrome c oxidase assembly chaperone [Planctomycetota bacterium]
MQAFVDAMPLISMVLFVLIFAAVLVHVLTDRRRGHLDKMANAALEDTDLDSEGANRG